MVKEACDFVFIPQLGPDDVTDGSVENYDLDWPQAVLEDDPLFPETSDPVR